MARALATALFVAVLCVSGAGGAPAQTPERGGTVVIGVPAQIEPVCFNPLVQECIERGGVLMGEMWGLALASPFERGPDLAFRPDVVSDVTVRKRPFTLTYRIRPHARWSDGAPLAARDFVFTYDALRRTPNLLPDDPIRRITRIDVLDRKTFRVRVGVRLPVSAWKAWLLVPTPSHVLSGRDLQSFWRDTIDDPRTGRPIGSGPFLMQSRQRGRHITFVRNPAYWGPHKAYVHRIVFRFLSSSELPDALRSGRIDVIFPVSASEEAAREVRSRPSSGVRVASALAPAWEHLAFRVGSGGHPALRSKLVRRALAYGVDRGALVRTLEDRVFGRSTPPLAPLQSVVFVPESPYYAPNWARYRHRPVLARRLLAEAGCRVGSGGIHLCGNERLSLTIATTAGSERRTIALALLEEQLRELGVDVRPAFLPGVGALLRSLQSGDVDLVLFAWSFDVNGLGARFRCGGNENLTGHCSRLVTRELENAERVLYDEAQARALNRAERLLVEAVPVLPLFRAPTLVAYRASIRNLEPGDLLWNAEEWWLER